MPNKIGNLCIAGHNYINNTFFGRLNLLRVGDTIKITDLNNLTIEYKIYLKKEISKKDFSCISQDTNDTRIVTLMTCNSLKDTRLILVAREKK